MEIKFLLPDLSIVDSPYEFKGLLKKGQYDYYLRLKALEFKEGFPEWVESIRGKYHIEPEKLLKEVLIPTIKNGKNNFWNTLNEELSRKKMPDLVTGQIVSLQYLEKLNLQQKTKLKILEYNGLAEIILFGTVYFHTNDQSIFVKEEKDEFFNSVSIILTEFKTKTALITFIRNNYNEHILPKLIKAKGIKKKEKFNISQQTLEVLKYRQHLKLSFPQIAEVFKNGEKPFSLNSDTLRKSYHRAIDKINSI